MRIYTRTGDGGETSLFNGDRVHKDDARIEAYGTLDELNAIVGGLLDHEALAPHADQLHAIQDHLFRIGGIFADPEGPRPGALTTGQADIEGLEQWIDAMEEPLEPLRNFVLPGGHPVLSACHLARTISRRAERRAVALDRLVGQPGADSLGLPATELVEGRVGDPRFEPFGQRPPVANDNELGHQETPVSASSG